MTVNQPRDPIRRDDARDQVVIICHEFSTETSAHGMSHIIRARGKRRKLFWIVITLGLLAVWILHSQDTIRKFLKNEINVQVEIKTSRELPFPAVTICNKNPYKMDEFINFVQQMNHTASTRAARGEPIDDIAPPWFLSWMQLLVEGDENFESSISSAKFGEQLLQLVAELVEIYGEYYNQSLHELSINPDDFVLSCMYEREDCDNREDISMVTFFNWLYGTCSVFLVKHNATRTGPRFGLELTLNIQQEDYLDLTTQAGALVMVHPPDQMPFPEDEGISIPPGQAALIGVKLKKRERLGGKYGNCINNDKPPNITNYFNEEFIWTNYSLKTCQRSCFQSNVRQTCQCLDVRFPPYDEYQNFTSCLSKYYTSYNFSKGWPTTVGCQDDVTTKFNKNSLGCDELCHVACKETLYEPTVSYAAWPSDASLNATLESLKGMSANADEILELGYESFRKNFLQVTVYFQDLNYELLSEKVAVELTQMLSDLGGNTGMYVGASLFTIVEFVELFGDLWLWICCHTKRRKRPKYAPPTDEDFPQANHINYTVNSDNNTPNYRDNKRHDKINGHDKHSDKYPRNKRGQENGGFYPNSNGHLGRPSKKGLPRTPMPMEFHDSGLY